MGILLNEDVVVNPVVAVEDGHEARHLGAVGNVVGGVAALGGTLGGDHIGTGTHAGEGTGQDVVHHGHALGGPADGGLGQQDVVVDEGGAVADLHEDVLAHVHHTGIGTGGNMVVVHQVLGEPGALGLPVGPDAHGAVVDVVPAEDHIDGGVELDAAHLGAGELLGVVDVVDVVVLDDGEHAAHSAHDAGLATVMDVAAADDVGANGLLGPAVVLGDAHRIPLHLGGTLHVLVGEVVVVALLGLMVVAEGDAAAAGVGDVAVLNDPALGPVGADHAVLVGGGRSPVGGSLVHHEAAEGDVAHTLLIGHEAVVAHVDLHALLVGVLALEVGVDGGLLLVHLGKPLVDGQLWLPGLLEHLALDALLQGKGLVEHLVVHVHGAPVHIQNLSGGGVLGIEVPVADDGLLVGVEAVEHAVVHLGHPGGSLIGHPSGEQLGAGDPGTQGHLGAVLDPGILPPCVDRVDVLPVNTGGDGNHIAGHGNLRRIVDVLEGHLLGAVALTGGRCIDIVNHTVFSFTGIWCIRSYGMRSRCKSQCFSCGRAMRVRV